MKPLSAFCIAVIIYGGAVAQGSHFSVGFGYGFPAGDRLGISEQNNVEKNISGSFGKGLTIGLNTGYMVNDNVGLDLGIWYVMGATYKVESGNGSNGSDTHLASGNTLRIMPAAKIKGGKLNRPYVKFGPLLGISTTLNDDETFTSPQTTVYANHKYTGGTSFGWTGAFGIDFSEDQNTSIFLEINFCHQVFKPSLEIISIAGQDDDRFTLVDEPNPNDPDEKLRPTFPFSTVTVSAGVKFSSFRKKKDTAGAK